MSFSRNVLFGCYGYEGVRESVAGGLHQAARLHLKTLVFSVTLAFEHCIMTTLVRRSCLICVHIHILMSDILSSSDPFPSV